MSFEGKVTGASLRGTAGANNSFKGLADGSRWTQGCFMVGVDGNPERAVMCESPIDALISCHAALVEEKYAVPGYRWLWRRSLGQAKGNV